jgi:hypothetical protein
MPVSEKDNKSKAKAKATLRFSLLMDQLLRFGYPKNYDSGLNQSVY